jgi:hypothetical protein
MSTLTKSGRLRRFIIPFGPAGHWKLILGGYYGHERNAGVSNYELYKSPLTGLQALYTHGAFQALDVAMLKYFKDRYLTVPPVLSATEPPADVLTVQ